MKHYSDHYRQKGEMSAEQRSGWHERSCGLQKTRGRVLWEVRLEQGVLTSTPLIDIWGFATGLSCVLWVC